MTYQFRHLLIRFMVYVVAQLMLMQRTPGDTELLADLKEAEKHLV